MIAGNITYGMCQWGMLIAIARLGSSEMVGQFALALAVTAPIVLLLGLDLRTIQATDQSNRYSFADYFGMRLLTMSAALVVIAGIAIGAGYEPEMALLIVAMGVSKSVESLSELCCGTLQQHERLDLFARSQIIRGPLSLLAMAGALYLTRSLLFATLVLALSWTCNFLLVDRPAAICVLHQNGQTTKFLRFEFKRLARLLVIALPVGILSCQVSLEVCLPRLCIDGCLGQRDVGKYAAVAFLVFAATTVINAVHSAALPRVARLSAQGKSHLMLPLLLKLGIFGGLLGLLGTLTTVLCGEFLLRVTYGPEYGEQAPLLVVLMLGATVRYATSPAATGIRAVGRFWILAALQAIVLVVAAPLLILLIHHFDIMGAAYAMALLAVLFSIVQIPAALYICRPHSPP